ncbi:DUF7144 family membrane protein [Cryptosporangium aurantiacum]|uniref:DUF7144 family membrane protein n=1 Tax=Cryptosporangium aurantiacum TaxID=134849 RepID=UPI001C49FD2D|nr:YhjD/YihY/BrkB family envelope integrity protein [Cryptosporangium aurantiacum]
MTRPSGPEPPHSGSEGLSLAGVLAALPRRLQPRAALLLGNRIGRLLLDTATALVRAQVFDRAMTIAAQAFTSIFPLLIMAATLAGAQKRAQFGEALGLPETSVRLLREALRGSGSSTFGVVGSLIVLLSATGLTRALVRAYRAVWSVRTGITGPAATGRQLGTVVVLVFFVVGARFVDRLTTLLPAPHAAGAVATALVDGAFAILLPRLLLGSAAPRTRVLVSGCVFGLMMIGVRAAGAVWLPRALEHSAERYGVIGIAFAYISWLYVLSFCLLLSAVLGAVLTDADFVPRGWRPRIPVRARSAGPRHRSAEERSMTDTEYRAAGYDRPPGAPAPSGWVGVVSFAGIMLLLIGGFQLFEGIVALVKDDYYLVTDSGLMLPVDLTVWGWIHILVGAIAIAVGIGVLYGKTWARILGVGLAVINAITHLLFAPAQPIWAIIAVVLDVLIIYALVVHGREVRY